MTRIVERTVLFADLRGSTALYERIGNAQATTVVTLAVAQLVRIVAEGGGQVVKTLGDGLMAVFAENANGVMVANRMHEQLDSALARGSGPDGPSGLRIQIALARGEGVEMAGDCFGDAVNVAARLIDHAGDNEVLVTDAVFTDLPQHLAARFRSLDWMHLRGRADPVFVHLMGGRRNDLDATTQFDPVMPSAEPDGLRLIWARVASVFASGQLPVVIGRSPQSGYCVDDARVSRSHARIDWHAGSIQLTDLSYNGTYVRFGRDKTVLSLRRSTCTLHGHGSIGLGGSPADAASPVISFEVLRFADTQPRELLDDSTL